MTNDGETDAKDALAFVPTKAEHRDALNFDFQILFEENADGHSIIGAYHANSPGTLAGLLEERFWRRLTQVPGAGMAYDKVKVQVGAFGRGKVTSDAGGIDIDSERADPSQDVSRAFFDRSADGNITLTAAPVAETGILSWRGCDAVSDDKTACEVSLRTDRLVTVSFGYKETILKEDVVLVDLLDAEVVASADQVTLDATAGAGDAEMKAKLAGLSAGDIVVGTSGDGFLRRVATVQKISDANYVLTTEDASLEDVIAQGTAAFSKQMTQSDLDAGVDKRSARSAGPAAAGFEGIDGVRLLPSDDPDSEVFTLQIGGGARDERATLGLEDTLSWEDPKGCGSLLSIHD